MPREGVETARVLIASEDEELRLQLRLRLRARGIGAIVAGHGTSVVEAINRERVGARRSRWPRPPRYRGVDEDGGDGRRSITWHETDRALQGQKPVFAFLADDQAEGDGHPVGDEARLGSLTEFKQFLARCVVYDRFGSPDDLAAKAATSLANWLLERAAGSSPRFDKNDFRLESTEYLATQFPIEFEQVGPEARAMRGAVARAQNLVVKFQDCESSEMAVFVWLTVENRGAEVIRWFGPLATCYRDYVAVPPDLAADGGHHIADLYAGEHPDSWVPA